ncbi:MAG TPA: ROK family protein [Pyrinomonadaceae bacterium]|nr:ROK family protein [Pyrinomonadaceae bacterium]
MPTLRDVAALAGVSTATVSHVINDTRRITNATRARVEEAIERLGFVPNHAGRALALHKSANGGGGAVAVAEVAETDGRAWHGWGTTTDEQSAVEQSAAVQASATQGSTGAARMILRLVRAAQPVPRVEIARRLGVHRSTVTEVLKPLITAGVLREETETLPSGASRASGRPPVALSFADLNEFFVGVSVGVRRTQVGVSRLDGEVVEEDDFETPGDPAEAMSLLRSSIQRLCARVPGRELKVIGVSVPGPTDGERRKLLYAPHLGWRDVDVADALRLWPCGGGEEEVPVVVENDATAAAVYEARLRLRERGEEPFSNFAVVRSGTGIGVGLVIEGEVYRGTGDDMGLAGEFGHMTIVAGGKQCPCGNRGCWERYASASSASALYAGERAQVGGQPAPRYVEIVARAEGGELRARRTLEHLGEYLGIGIANVITGLGVSRIIISGRLVYGWKFICGPLREAVGQSMAGRLSGWLVEPGEPTGAGLGGALEVAADEFLTRVLTR